MKSPPHPPPVYIQHSSFQSIRFIKGGKASDTLGKLHKGSPLMRGESSGLGSESPPAPPCSRRTLLHINVNLTGPLLWIL